MPTGLDFGHIRGSATFDLGRRKRSPHGRGGREFTALPRLGPGSRSSSCPHSSRRAERAEDFWVPAPSHQPPVLPTFSLSELFLHQALVGAVCGSGRWSVGDAGAAQCARASDPSSSCPVSSRLFGPVAKSPQSPSTFLAVPVAPEARGEAPNLPENLLAGPRDWPATASRWGGGAWSGRRAGLGREAGRGACEWAGRPPGGGDWRSEPPAAEAEA